MGLRNSMTLKVEFSDKCIRSLSHLEDKLSVLFPHLEQLMIPYHHQQSDLAFRLQLILVVLGELLRLHAHAYTCSMCTFKHRVFVKQVHDSAVIKCNTEKDKHRIKNHTAGMMDVTTQNICKLCAIRV